MTTPDDALDRLIFDGQHIPAIKHIKDSQGISLGEAIIHFYKRVDQLSHTSPEKFTVSIKDYFKDVYS